MYFIVLWISYVFLCFSTFCFCYFFRKIYHRTFFKHNYAKMNWFQPMKVKIIISLWIRWENSIYIDFVHKITFLSHFQSDEHVEKVVQRRNGMPDFRENGVIRCARLESKKSASGAVKKNLHGGMVAQNVEGGVDSTPPPAVLGLKSTDITHSLQWTHVIKSTDITNSHYSGLLFNLKSTDITTFITVHLL